MKRQILVGAALIAACGGDTQPPVDNPPQQLISIKSVVDRNYRGELEKLLASAQSEVLVVHFELNTDGLGDEVLFDLRDAAARGVKVRVLLENSVRANETRVPELIKNGIEAKLDDGTRYTHAKLVVVDGKRALLGSTNWSYMSVERNWETSVLIGDADIAGYFQKYAAALWAAPAEQPVLAAVERPGAKPYSDGGYVGRARPLIENAKRRIMVMTYGMNVDPKYPDSEVRQLIRALGDAKRRGVEVRAILEAADWNPGITELNRDAAKILQAEGVDAKMDPLEVITHAKVLVVDDSVIVGSNNWGHGGFRLYHEVGVETSVPQVVTDMVGYFDNIWWQSTPP